jgi:hypothetical protein
MRARELRFDPTDYGVVGPGPDLYIHYAHDQAQVKSIVRNGFDLKKFGFTAKKYNAAHMAANDPRGIFATNAAGIDPKADGRPYVIFKVPSANVLTAPDPDDPGAALDLKTKLSSVYGAKMVAKVLLAADIHVLHSTYEFIILDTKRVQIVAHS